ncbi:MFS transporter [Paludibacterium purpuratum]|uniref:Putative MFS family arabinose efflux permease n=1 Tax=Paludibacterium purpuratum TaxID=1144873 RepID=A0A4R7B3K1_9NEIS|nr:MFS transporter [Paludibacterium purpuratum]TDR78382.1 putative MFS family arabinose efflux permease [Paludibacterium purpuratum]
MSVKLSVSRWLGIDSLGPPLWHFQFSFFILTVGGRCTQLAVAWWALAATHSATVFSYMVACAIAAEVLAKPLLGWVGDRHDKIRVLLICNVVNVIGAFALWLLAAIGWFQPVLVGALMVVGSLAVGLRDPLQSSIIPALVDKERVALAFRSKSIMSSLALLIGPGLAGALVSIWGVGTALALEVAAATIAAALAWKLLAIPQRFANRSSVPHMGWLSMIVSGFKTVYRVRTEFFLALLAMVVNFALYPFFSILVPLFVKNSLSMPAWYVGVLDASFGLGILFGSYLGIGWLSKWLPRDASIALGFALLGGNLFVTGRLLPPWLIPAAFAAGGMGLMLINVHAATVRTLATPASHRNRMAATVAFFSSAASPVGSMTIGMLLGSFSLSGIMMVLGGMVCVLAMTVFFIPYFKQVMWMPDDRLDGVYAEIYPNAFEDPAQGRRKT